MKDDLSSFLPIFTSYQTLPFLSPYSMDGLSRTLRHILQVVVCAGFLEGGFLGPGTWSPPSPHMDEDAYPSRGSRHASASSPPHAGPWATITVLLIYQTLGCLRAGPHSLLFIFPHPAFSPMCGK